MGIDNLDKLRIISVLKDKLLVGPRSLYVDINNFCNINCNFCWIHSPLIKKPIQQKPLKLNFSEIKEIVDKAKDWGCKDIMISGDGEPTLHPEFKEIVEYIISKELKITLSTNATFNEDLLPTISKIDYLNITFTAPTEKSYNKIHSSKAGIYETVIKNIKILSLLKKRYHKPFLNIAFIINKTNYKFILKMFDFAEKVGIDMINLRIMEPTKYTKKLVLSKKEKKELIKIIDIILNNNFTVYHNSREVKTGIINYIESAYNVKSCFSGWFNIFVDCNKNVGLCCHNENIIIGNLKNKSIKEIWESKEANNMRLLCKYKFDIRKYPFKNECEWCHWYRENNIIKERLEKLQNVNRS